MLASDNFSDPSIGILPRQSSSPTVQQGYVSGEYQILATNLLLSAARAMIPGDYPNVTVSGDVHLAGGVTDAGSTPFVGLVCSARGPTGYNMHYVLTDGRNPNGQA